MILSIYTTLLSLLWVLLPSFSMAQDEITSTARFQSIGLETRIQGQIGIWEEVEFAYSGFKNFSSSTVFIKSADAGRGIAGLIVTLATPDKKEHVWGLEYADLTKYPTHFDEKSYSSEEVAPTESLDSSVIDLRSLFGELQAGHYKLRLKITGDRYRINQQPGRDLDSGWLAFEILPLSPKVQEFLKQAQQQQSEKVRIIPEKSFVTAEQWIVSLPCNLENNLPTALELWHEGLMIVNGVERLDATLQWREHNDWCGRCGNGLTQLQVASGKQQQARISLPGRRGIYRATLSKAPALGKVYSTPVQIVRKPTP